MKLPDREYYLINEAAERLNCTPMDLIHYASTGKLKIAGFLRLEHEEIETVPYDGEDVHFGYDGLYYLEERDLEKLLLSRSTKSVEIEIFYPIRTYLFPISVNGEGNEWPYILLNRKSCLVLQDELVVFQKDLLNFLEKYRNEVSQQHSHIKEFVEELRNKNEPNEIIVYELRKKNISNVDIGRILGLGEDKTKKQLAALKTKVQRLYATGKKVREGNNVP